MESANEGDWWLIKRAAVSQLWKSRCAPALLHNGSAGRGKRAEAAPALLQPKTASRFGIISTGINTNVFAACVSSVAGRIRVLASSLQKGYQGHGECDTIHIISGAHGAAVSPWSRWGELIASFRNQEEEAVENPRDGGSFRCAGTPKGSGVE